MSAENRVLEARAPFQEDLRALRDALPGLIPLLEAQPGWYGSVYFERKGSRTFTANLRQTQVSDQATAGVVLRIYNGTTLFEQATDVLDESALPELARKFAARVAGTPPSEGATDRPYRAPTWAERLSTQLDPEITTQIPLGVTASTPVHFGIRFVKDPMRLSTEDFLSRARGILARCQELAPKAGLLVTDLSYAVVRVSVADEEAIFVDGESNLSQRLYRMALTVVLMSGADRVYTRQGGLGGVEAVEVEDSLILEMLHDLKALKTAQRLQPGKHRVLLGPVATGVLAHEAFGHSQEGDTCARGRSKAWEIHLEQKKGAPAKVGNEHATILNNPAIFRNAEAGYAAWGSYFFDEEGWLSQSQVILDRGVLQAPMTNLTSALRLGIPRTANGKRESWAHGVYTRQTNTYFAPGKKTLSQLMEMLGDGYLATDVAGGMEDPKGMGIQVGLAFLKEVKGGKLTGRVLKGPAGGDVQLTGYVPEVLDSIVDASKIQFDREELDTVEHPQNDVGGCGKYHKELVQAGCGGPYLLLDSVTLG